MKKDDYMRISTVSTIPKSFKMVIIDPIESPITPTSKLQEDVTFPPMLTNLKRLSIDLKCVQKTKTKESFVNSNNWIGIIYKDAKYNDDIKKILIKEIENSNLSQFIDVLEAEEKNGTLMIYIGLLEDHILSSDFYKSLINMSHQEFVFAGFGKILKHMKTTYPKLLQNSFSSI
jgi:hypothetical protein